MPVKYRNCCAIRSSGLPFMMAQLCTSYRLPVNCRPKFLCSCCAITAICPLGALVISTSPEARMRAASVSVDHHSI